MYNRHFVNEIAQWEWNGITDIMQHENNNCVTQIFQIIASCMSNKLNLAVGQGHSTAPL